MYACVRGKTFNNCQNVTHQEKVCQYDADYDNMSHTLPLSKRHATNISHFSESPKKEIHFFSFTT